MALYDRVTSLSTLTPDFLREHYLLGLSFVDDAGTPYPDSWYEQKINVAISQFEHHSQLKITPEDYVGEPHDYYIKDYEHYAFLQLHNYPVIPQASTPVVKAIYPTGQVVTTFPTEWVRLDEKKGQIQLVPTQGSLSQVILGQGGSYLPIIYQGLGYLPQLFQVDYTAGFADGEIPWVILDGIAKLATIELLSVMGDAVRPAGITNQSLSIDGLSQSRGFQNSNEMAPIFSGRLSQYKRELYGDPQRGVEGIFNQIKRYYRGVNMMVMA